jgi:hypothetical protein
MSSQNPRYIFWLSDISILYRNNNYLNFFPTSTMSRTEQLNSITLFCIYFIILSYVLNKDSIWFQIPIITIIITVILHQIYDYDSAGKIKEIERMNNLQNDDDQNDDDQNDNDRVIIETGYYDENNRLQIQKQLNKKKRKTYTLDQIAEYKAKTCKIPTNDNPFMNPVLQDITVIDPPEPCNVDDTNIKEKITEKFNNDLFRDVGDLFEVKNSQRQFFTVSHDLPDTVGFANWLYGDKPSCKSSQSACYNYENLKYKAKLM